ncbi:MULTISPECIES: DUF3005 domain-containing protein [Burkholderia]|jgi:hypothetical protein|uniref:DUF3005 domain-containing protein n=4 Tax=Pseudomonadota TaxID=1224 RepID=A0A1E3FXI8_9BURK|nr:MULTISPECIES: DUF3005 domain-containing protein [Burkholderia]UTP25265.1 DUF3005 domain-containing protein [Burkholderia sp. FXe9]KKL32830.1 2-oxoglutarate dehydrogenase [Burkholderia contaminans LMG 23361]MBA9827505.1 DUF3005 domain-containing protein [Burkholderia contaminans]MBA9836486.1 DUF3005 domain-containing protein [Burkholderia contaminans]MBA9860990.1 DUF3005 domain-containing protein [Burkholderia contaminans]
MQNAESNPTPEKQREQIEKSPVKTPAAGDMPDAATQAAQVAQHPLTPEKIAGKMPTGLPPIERGTQAPDSGDPVRRAAARIPTLDNANMAMTDNTVDVDGKGMEAAAGASKWHDNVIYSNASLDEAVETPDEGLGGIESRPSGNMPQIATRPGWRVRHIGDVDVEHGDRTRAEHVIVLERNN